MALGNKKCSALKSKSKSKSDSKPKGHGVNVGESVVGLEFVKFTRGLGRKRVLLYSEIEESMLGSPAEKTPAKRVSGGDTVISGRGTSRLESLPQEILVRIICGVEHDDLNQLFYVSKTIRAATLIAKQSHFAYSTPKKLISRNSFIFDEPIGLDDEIEAPNAPKRKRVRRSQIAEKEFSGISTSLFN